MPYRAALANAQAALAEVDVADAVASYWSKEWGNQSVPDPCLLRAIP
ncbi:MAG: hypothetical protein ORN29_07220 [Rhodoferax sp.]|nr:hypothetical protein [Rhodoferax sp.]